MGIRDYLGLDHFYVGFDHLDFNDWKQIIPLLPASKHKVVQSGNDQWEGIYVSARDGSYWEIVLRDHPPNNYNSGLALSTRFSHYYDASNIMQEMPDLDWTKGLRVRKNNEPWFEYCSTWTNANTAAPFDMWTMKYFPAFQDTSDQPAEPKIQSFDALELEFHRDDHPAIKNSSVWAPGENSWDSDMIRLRIPQKNWSVFEMIFKSSEDVAPGTVRFKSLKATLVSGFCVPTTNIGKNFYVSQKQTQLVFEREPGRKCCPRSTL